MNTVFLLMAKYDAQPILSADVVCRDFFPHLNVDKFLRKVSAGEIELPLIRMDGASQKTAKGVHIQDLADYIEKRRAAAAKELRQIIGR